MSAPSSAFGVDRNCLDSEVAPLTRRVAEHLGERMAAFGIRSSDFRKVLWPGAELYTVTLLEDGGDRSLEAVTGHRVNPDMYDIDLDERREAADLIAEVIALGVARPLFLYRPSWRIEAAAEQAGVRVLAPPVRTQRALEDKRAVDTALKSLGMPTLGWFDPTDPLGSLGHPGPFVVRSAGQGGGAGMVLVDDIAAARSIPGGVSASPFLDGAASLNLSGCCFADGTVSVHLATLQVIGAAGCTTLPFGYCGNDGAGVARVDPAGVRAAEELTAAVGRWLHKWHGWRGAYGVDVLVTEGTAQFCELNPRFQGSSRMATHHAQAQGRPGLFVEHLAAVCDLEVRSTDVLGTEGYSDSSQIVVHNLEDRPVVVGRPTDLPPGWSVELLAGPGTQVAPGGPIGRLLTRGSVTSDGGGLTPEARSVVDVLQQAVGR